MLKKILFWTLIVLIPLGLFVWWNWFTDVPLKISPETSLMTDYLTPDGKGVDFSAWLVHQYPEGFQSERNAAWQILKEFDLRNLQDRDQEYLEISDYAWIKLCGLMKLDPDAPRQVCKTPFTKTMEEYFDAKSPDDRAPFLEARAYLLFSNSKTFRLKEFVEKNEDFVRTWVEENSPVLDRIEEILLDTKSEFFFFPFLEPEGIYHPLEILMPTTHPVEGLGKSLIIRAIWNLSQGNTEKAIHGFEAVNRMGILTQKGSPEPLNYGLGVRLQNMGLEIPFTEAKTPLTAEQWKRLMEIPLYEFSPEEYLRTTKSFEFPICLHFIKYCSDRKFSDSFGELLPPPDSKYWYFGYDWNQIAREFREAQKEVEADFQKDPMNTRLDIRTTLKDDPQSAWVAGRRFFLSTRKTRSHLVSQVLICQLPLYAFRELLLDRMTCAHMFRLHCALQLYRLDHDGQLPPAFTTDAEGKPLHSWTVQLLPYLGKETEELYAKIRLDEPWDSEWNTQFHKQMPGVFVSCDEPGDTEKTSFGLVTEGEKYALVQNMKNKNWMDPTAFMTEKEVENPYEDRFWTLENNGTMNLILPPTKE